jgi:TolA-binding protein
MQIADKCRDSKKHEKALQLYNDIIAEYPQTKSAMWARQNLVKFEIDNDAESDESSEQVPPYIIDLVDQFMAHFPESSDMTVALCFLGEHYYNAALANERKGLWEKGNVRFRKALPLFAKVIDHAPFHPRFTPDAWYMSAVASSRLGDYATSIEYHQTIVDNWPDHHLAWSSQYWIGSHYQQLKKSDTITAEEADAASEQAFLDLFEKYPGNPMTKHACSQLAMIYYKTHQWENAVALYEQILGESPPDDKIPRSTYYLARSYEAIGQKEMAARTYREFATAYPESSSAARATAAADRLGGLN